MSKIIRTAIRGLFFLLLKTVKDFFGWERGRASNVSMKKTGCFNIIIIILQIRLGLAITRPSLFLQIQGIIYGLAMAAGQQIDLISEPAASFITNMIPMIQ